MMGEKKKYINQMKKEVISPCLDRKWAKNCLKYFSNLYIYKDLPSKNREVPYHAKSVMQKNKNYINN